MGLNIVEKLLFVFKILLHSSFSPSQLDELSHKAELGRGSFEISYTFRKYLAIVSESCLFDRFP